MIETRAPESRVGWTFMDKHGKKSPLGVYSGPVIAYR